MPLLDAMLLEMEMQKDYLENTVLDSIYFGGGTPSILTEKDLVLIFEKIFNLFKIKPDAEITLEANPDDLDREKLKMLKTLPVNRLSIGVQSFFEADLTFWNRAHNAEEALNCIRNAQEEGFTNLTVDLIYGSPTTSDENWLHNIKQLLAFEIPHLSCYALTVEERTALAHFVKTGKARKPEDEHTARQYEMLMKIMQDYSYDHYEISNFAKPGFYAVHNSSYWKGEKYLGIGPAAHSYDGQSRQWNIANNAYYMKAIKALMNNETPTIPLFEKETLNKEQRYNEYVMTGLRTIWGCEEQKLDTFGIEFKSYFMDKSAPYLDNGQMIFHSGAFILSPEGKLLADQISVDLFMG